MSLPSFGFSTTSDEVVDALSATISGKNVLITGTTLNTIGFEAARAIAKHAAIITITGYNADRLQLSAETLKKEAPTAVIRHIQLDLSSLDAVRNAAALLNEQPEPLHVLIHNAAHTNGTTTITKDDIEIQLAVDHFAPFLLTKLLLAKLLRSASADWTPRVVYVASEVHALGPGIDLAGLRKPVPGSESEKNLFLRYHEAKQAVVMTAGELAKRADGKLRVYSLHPGLIFTNAMMQAEVVPTMKAIGALKEDGQPNPDYKKWKTIPQGAATTIVAAFDPRLDDKSGSYLVDCVEANDQRAPNCVNPANREKVWKLTEGIIGEKFEL
ncbi:Short-chain dehydrogenase/reductase family protein [Mycena indigotica]|uniref:Short-chain dehydrogenase/reductase family protein n=1 Tax=Mycena indigotica TaxID=2126181 RepID=A0A8H6SFH3_9AGAR|nr:Short-chain dehydrogenase/reductase family protein [Mycena indigotica]KAF7298625.1 Short-chain dehydrogenase/reductase family protein [Mycena indigotica]